MYLWGAGILGAEALKHYGHDNVKAFIDNSLNKQGTLYCGKDVISFDNYLNNGNGERIILCLAWENVLSVQKQLKLKGIVDYYVYMPQLFENVDLIYNQYEIFDGITEEVWNNSIALKNNINRVEEYVNKYKNNVSWPDEIEIETINRCNGSCAFCPVNVNSDIRTYELMKESLFNKIVDELEKMDYAGRVALFSNNEPFLDKRIVDFSRILRQKVSKAHIHLFTNGSLLSIEIFESIIDYLDELIIDNYNQELLLNPKVKIIKEYVEKKCDEKVRKKVKILLRKPNEYLSSRGGDAPNRRNVIDVSKTTCALPYCQMIIRPSGKVSLCCNDPYGKDELGDLNTDSILSIWYGDKYNDVRKKIEQGRSNYEHCKCCDTFMII